MADKTKIEWADATVNAINGCSLESPGCTNCYAMGQAHRFPIRAGLTQHSKGGMVWTGEVRLHEPALMQPLKWKKPRRIFWNAHGDTFHENVPDEWIDRVFAVCALTPQHTHMILTKRSARMRRYLNWITCDVARRFHVADAAGRMMEDGDKAHATVAANCDWPLPNVWLGVSVEDQKRADERRADFEAIHAARKFVSFEPALEIVDWTGWEFIDQLISGGESGPKARVVDYDAFRSARDWCADRGVAFFHKQNGEFDEAGNRVGKKRAGRLLDGVTHDEFPATLPKGDE